MLTTVDGDTLCIYNVRPTTTTDKAMKRNMFKNTTDKSNGILKNVPVTHRKEGKRETTENKEKSKYRVAD